MLKRCRKVHKRSESFRASEELNLMSLMILRKLENLKGNGYASGSFFPKTHSHELFDSFIDSVHSRRKFKGKWDVEDQYCVRPWSEYILSSEPERFLAVQGLSGVGSFSGRFYEPILGRIRWYWRGRLGFVWAKDLRSIVIFIVSVPWKVPRREKGFPAGIHNIFIVWDTHSPVVKSKVDAISRQSSQEEERRLEILQTYAGALTLKDGDHWRRFKIFRRINHSSVVCPNPISYRMRVSLFIDRRIDS